MKPRIIIDDNIPYISGRLEPVADITYVNQFGFTPELVHDADALVIRTRTRCDSSLLSGTKVRMIATATIGTDHIDLAWCGNHNIRVSNAPGCNAPGVAQYVWSALLREGFDPTRHTLGVVGCGSVGSIVALWGKLLGAEVLVSDPPRQRRGVIDNYAPLERIMAECDAVTLHTPLTRSGANPTFHLISGKEISSMKPGAILVNAARGEVLDTVRALPLLRQKKIKTVIDTWEGEPEISSELLDIADIATFHIAGYSRQGKERAVSMVLTELDDFFGFETDKSGLAPAYKFPETLSAQKIIDSYDPFVDTHALKINPQNFDLLRRDYLYREEVN